LTLYGHLSQTNVRCGELIAAGQVIGAVGSTGNSSGPHLHFEIRNGNTPTDPLATMPGLGS
jgi:murein DD-endopeptidase MepM/ murein hydrolase activator NlpD